MGSSSYSEFILNKTKEDPILRRTQRMIHKFNEANIRLIQKKRFKTEHFMLSIQDQEVVLQFVIEFIVRVTGAEVASTLWSRGR